jgi:hypothetical protein
MSQKLRDIVKEDEAKARASARDDEAENQTDSND